MMFINAFVAAAILAASVVTAAPAADLTAVTAAAPAEALAPREARTIKLCRSSHWTSCENSARAPPGSCENLSLVRGVGDMMDMISSLDTRGFQCTFFVDAHCQPDTGSFPFNGSLGNLKTHTGLQHFQDKISSYRCD